MSNAQEKQRESVAELASMSVSERRERISDLDELLSADSLYVQSRAMESVVELSEQYPEDVTPLIDTLATQLGDDALGEDAALVIGNIAAEDPSIVRDRLPVLVALINTGGAVTVNVTYALASLGESSPESLTQEGILAQLFSLIDDDAPSVRTNVTGILGAIAEAEPGAIVDSADLIVDRLEDPAPAVLENTLRSVGHLGAVEPETVFDALPKLCDHLESDDPAIRAQVRFALGSVIDGASDVEEAALDPLAGWLADSDPLVRQQATYLFGEIAGANADAVTPFAEELARRFADTEAAVRQNALRAIAALETDHPERAEAAREDLEDTLERSGTDGADAPFTAGELRGLATEEHAPADLRRSAREALVRVGSDEGTRQAP